MILLPLLCISLLPPIKDPSGFPIISNSALPSLSVSALAHPNSVTVGPTATFSHPSALTTCIDVVALESK